MIKRLFIAALLTLLGAGVASADPLVTNTWHSSITTVGQPAANSKVCLAVGERNTGASCTVAYYSLASGSGSTDTAAINVTAAACIYFKATVIASGANANTANIYRVISADTTNGSMHDTTYAMNETNQGCLPLQPGRYFADVWRGTGTSVIEIRVAKRGFGL
jgi:hypothetical protein